MLRGMAKDWKIRESFTKESLQKKYGNVKVSTGPVPYSDKVSI
jgi:hypothetical protein